MQSRKTSADLWHQKPYYSLDAWCKNTYGRKLYKAALDIGCTCPNRDGTLDTRGCIFCSAGGSGDFAASRQLSVTPIFSDIPTRMAIRTVCFPVMKPHVPRRRSQAFPLRRARIVFPISFWRDLTASGCCILTGLSGSSLVCSPFMTTLQQGSAGDIRPPYFMMLQQSSMPEGFPLSSI